MKMRGLLSLALRDMDAAPAAAYILVLALSLAALLYAGAIQASVTAEKNEPCELTVTARGQNELTDDSVSDILALENVVSATGCIRFSASVESGDYSAVLQLVGIDGTYLEADCTTGGRFPASSSMPWLLLTLSAAKAFTDPNDTGKHDEDDLPTINWLDADFTIQLGSDQVPARVSGIMHAEESVGYLDLSTAKQLLQKHGLPSAYTSVSVRIVNIGAKQGVSKAVGALGYQITDDSDDLQQKWDTRLREAVYILLLAAALLLCAILIRIIAGIKDVQRKGAWYLEMLWMGLSCGRLKRLLVLCWVSLDLVGILLGVATAFAIPLFVENEQAADQVYITELSLPQVTICALVVFLLSIVLSVCISTLMRLFGGRERYETVCYKT